MDGDNYDPATGEIAHDQRPASQMTAPPQSERNLIFASPECGEVFGALAEAQGKMENPKKTKTATVKGTTRQGVAYDYTYAYAPLDEIMNVIRAPLAEAGLVHRQFLSQRGNVWVMRTIVAHRSGQWYGCDYPIFWDEARGMQGFASGVTYARRYGLMMALGLVGEDDDDANVADGNQIQIAPAGRSAARTAPASAGGGQTYPARQQAAPAPSAARAEADKRWREIRDEINVAMTFEDLDAISSSPAWAACEGKYVEAASEDGGDRSAAMQRAATAMDGLRSRIESRRMMLQDQMEGR